MEGFKLIMPLGCVLICLDSLGRFTDNHLVTPSKQAGKLWYGFWLLIVGIAAWFWPGFSHIHLIGPPAPSSFQKSSPPAK
jgi:hypothetical protein